MYFFLCLIVSKPIPCIPCSILSVSVDERCFCPLVCTVGASRSLIAARSRARRPPPRPCHRRSSSCRPLRKAPYNSHTKPWDCLHALFVRMIWFGPREEDIPEPINDLVWTNKWVSNKGDDVCIRLFAGAEQPVHINDGKLRDWPYVYSYGDLHRDRNALVWRM